MSLAPVRTITLGIEEAHPLTSAIIARAASMLREAAARFTDAGYEVQTTRISTRPFMEDLAARSPAEIVSYARDLQRMLDDAGLSFCSLGPIRASQQEVAPARIELLADVLAATSALNATVLVATLEDGLRAEALAPTARVMQRLAYETQEGFGNFNFALLACVEPGGPFFPAAYHIGPASLSIGMQGAHTLNEALQALPREHEQPLDLALVTETLRRALHAEAAPVVKLGQELEAAHGLRFGGIDLSPAPMGQESIASALEACGYGAVGSYGTLAVAAAFTTALKSVELPTCGYCGLMLPVLEDALLGRRWEEGRIHTHQLLLYSTVCGTGLDTLPLPGAIPLAELTALLYDVATLAVRLRKPLSARLFPVPGKRAGERTAFTSPYLTNTLIR